MAERLRMGLQGGRRWWRVGPMVMRRVVARMVVLMVRRWRRWRRRRRWAGPVEAGKVAPRCRDRPANRPVQYLIVATLRDVRDQWDQCSGGCDARSGHLTAHGTYLGGNVDRLGRRGQLRHLRRGTVQMVRVGGERRQVQR